MFLLFCFFFLLHDFRVCSCLSRNCIHHIPSVHLKIRMFTPYKLKSAVSYSRLVKPDKRFCFEIYRSLGSRVQSNFYEKNYLFWRLRLKYWWSFPLGEFMYYFELRNSLMLLTYAYNLVLKWAEYPSVLGQSWSVFTFIFMKSYPLPKGSIQHISRKSPSKVFPYIDSCFDNSNLVNML